MTQLQRKFSKSGLLRRALLQCMEADGIATGKGYKRLWNMIIADVFSKMQEAQIKRILYSFLQCDDITESERKEVLQLLTMAGTALTAAQIDHITEELRK